MDGPAPMLKRDHAESHRPEWPAGVKCGRSVEHRNHAVASDYARSDCDRCRGFSRLPRGSISVVRNLAETVVAVAVRDLRQILLVNLFGVVELTGRSDLCGYLAKTGLVQL